MPNNPEYKGGEQQDYDRKFRRIQAIEHLAEVGDIPHPERPVSETPPQDGSVFIPGEVECGVPGAPHGDGTL